MVKCLINVKTEKINVIKDIFAMLESISSEDIYIVFRKDETILSSSDVDSDEESKSKKKQKQKGGVLLKSINSNKTSISSIKLETNIFSEFITKEKEYGFWLNIKELNLWLKTIEIENHTLNIFIEKNDIKTIKFKCYHNDKENKFKFYEQCFSEADEEISNMPKIDFDYAISINAKLFKKICADMKQFSDYMEIKCDEEQILFQCLTKSNKLNIASYENGDGDIISKKINKNAKAIKSTYVLEFLLKLKYTSNICDNITLCIKNKSPLFINNTVCDGEIEYGKILLFFSPHNADFIDDNYHDKMKSCYKDKMDNIKANINKN